jgi:hypothetical protein
LNKYIFLYIILNELKKATGAIVTIFEILIWEILATIFPAMSKEEFEYAFRIFGG